MRETLVRSLGWEYLLERERLSPPVSWPGEFHGLYCPWGRRVGHDWATFIFILDAKVSQEKKKKKSQKPTLYIGITLIITFLELKTVPTLLYLSGAGGAEIKKQPLIDIHDQAVRGFDFFPPGEQTKNLPGKAFRAEPRELSFLPLVLPEPPPRPCPASWMDEPIRA